MGALNIQSTNLTSGKLNIRELKHWIVKSCLFIGLTPNTIRHKQACSPTTPDYQRCDRRICRQRARSHLNPMYNHYNTLDRSSVQRGTIRNSTDSTTDFLRRCRSPSIYINPTSEQGNRRHLDLLASFAPARLTMIALRELRSAG
jgi:hypothetical protein